MMIDTQGEDARVLESCVIFTRQGHMSQVSKKSRHWLIDWQGQAMNGLGSDKNLHRQGSHQSSLKNEEGVTDWQGKAMIGLGSDKKCWPLKTKTQRTQGNEYFDSFNTFSSKEKHNEFNMLTDKARQWSDLGPIKKVYLGWMFSSQLSIKP